MDDFLCVRELRNETGDGQETIKVAIGTPEKRSESEFACPFQLIGFENSKLQYAHGVDSFQALILALEAIRVHLERSGKSLTWFGGPQGDPGFPRYIPAFYGLDFSRHLNELIDGEIEKFAEKMQGRS